MEPDLETLKKIENVGENTSLNLQTIASHFDLKDHTTVSHACRKIESLRSTPGSISSAVQAIEDQL